MILKNNKRIDGCSDTVPVGTLNPFLGSTAPYGYLLCQGQKVSKTTYKELYEICGDTFGQSTDTEFYLPDLRGQTIAGYKEGDSTFGTLGGLIGSLTHLHSTGNHTLTVDEMPKHTHQVNIGTSNNVNSLYWGIVNVGGSDSIWTTTYSQDRTYSTTNYFGAASTGGSQPHNHGDTSSNSSLQPTVVLNWIVKAFQLMPNQSYVENSLESDSTINSLSAAKGKELNKKINNIKNTFVVNSSNLVIEPGIDITRDYNDTSQSYLQYQCMLYTPWITVYETTNNIRYFRLRVGYVQNESYSKPWSNIAVGINGGDTWSYRVGFDHKDTSKGSNYYLYEKIIEINTSQTISDRLVFIWEHETCGCNIKYIELCEMKLIS